MGQPGQPGPPGDEGEGRAFPRAPIELKVEYKRMNMFFADYTKNISRGGTFIRTTKPLDIGTEFIFKLQVPNHSEPLALRGQVRWVVREGEAPPPEAGPDHEPGMGIRFIFENEDERRIIEQMVEKMMIDSLGQLLYSKLMGKTKGAR